MGIILKIKVEGGGDAEAAKVDEIFAVFIDQFIPDQEGEMGCLDAGFFGGKGEFLVLGFVGLFLGEVAVFGHTTENLVLPTDGEVRVGAKGTVFGG